MENEEEKKKFLLSKDKNTLVELYLQKCFDTDYEKSQLNKQIEALKRDNNDLSKYAKALTNEYVTLLLETYDTRNCDI